MLIQDVLLERCRRIKKMLILLGHWVFGAHLTFQRADLLMPLLLPYVYSRNEVSLL